MTKIRFHDGLLAEKATLNAAISANKTERINSNNILEFTCRVRDSAAMYLNQNTVCSLDGDYYDVAFFKSEQQGRGLLLYHVQCEHVSYRLNDPIYNVEHFTMSGTPQAVLTSILTGTGFSVGTVEYTTAITISLQEAASRRGLLMYLVSQLGGELYCRGFEISILEHRGAAISKPLTVGKDVGVVSKTINKRKQDNLGNPVVSYACDVYKGTDLVLGDVVTLDYDVLDINATLRIVEISYDPYNPANVRVEVGNLSDRLEDDIYRIETETVAKNKTYYGTKIGPNNGFETIRSDKKARSIMNADSFAWQIGDGSGDNWVNKLYYDGNTNKIKLTGDVNMLSGSINWGEEGVESDPTINLLTSRVTTAELQIMPSAITTTVEDNTTLLAKKSYVDTTADETKIAAVSQVKDEYGKTISDISANFVFDTSGLTISRPTSELSVKITDTEMGFYDGSTKAAYINTGEFYINKGTVISSLTIGSHKIEKYNTGTTIFRFVG